MKNATLWVDQYGQVVAARGRTGLLKALCRKNCKKIYRDKLDGRTVHVGYCVAGRWFDAYRAIAIEIER